MHSDEAQNHNWAFKNCKREERILHIDVDDLDRILIWHKNLVSKNPFLKNQFINSKEVLEEKGPVTKEKCSIIIVIKVLKDIETWYKFYPESEKNQLDKETFKIVDLAINPPDPKRSES